MIIINSVWPSLFFTSSRGRKWIHKGKKQFLLCDNDYDYDIDNNEDNDYDCDDNNNNDI